MIGLYILLLNAYFRLISTQRRDMPTIKKIVSGWKFVARIRFLLMAGSVIASIWLLGYSLRQAGSLPLPPALSKSISSPHQAGTLPNEIRVVPASAFVCPTWQKPVGKTFWPGIQQPPTQSADEADLQDDAEVIGVCVEGRARAYEIAALSGGPEFHVVNDLLAGRPLTVVYCDLTRRARVLTSATCSVPLDIGVGGWDADKGLLLYVGGVQYALEDGKNITEPEEPPLPYQQIKYERMTWGQWRRAHPDTDVYLAPANGDNAREIGFRRGIRQPPTQSVDEADLEDDAEVIGVWIEGRARAYGIAALSAGPEFHVVNDVLSDRPVTVAYCDLTDCARVFTSKTRGSPFDIGVGGLDKDMGMMLYVDGARYALKDGKNLTHPDGLPLPYERMDYERTTWGEWRRVHPDTDVYLLAPCSS
jgi:hypothetical protein